MLGFKKSSANFKTSSPIFSPDLTALEAFSSILTVFSFAPQSLALLAAFVRSFATSAAFSAFPAVLAALPNLAILLACITNFPALVAPKPTADKAVNPKFPARFNQSDLSNLPSCAPSIASSTVLVAPPATPKIGIIDTALAIVEACCKPEAFLHALDTSCTVTDFPEDGVAVVFSEGCLEPLVLLPLSAIAAKDVPELFFSIYIG